MIGAKSGLKMISIWLGAQDFEARSAFDLLAPLTSPVQYMNSIPLDPFIPQGNSTYNYADNDPADPEHDHGLGALFPENASLFQLGVLNTGNFILVGVGPDGELGLGAGYGDPNRALPYNTTNGLVSAGDITMRGGGGINR